MFLTVGRVKVGSSGSNHYYFLTEIVVWIIFIVKYWCISHPDDFQSYFPVSGRGKLTTVLGIPLGNCYSSLCECHVLFIYCKDETVCDFSIPALYGKEVVVIGSLKVTYFGGSPS